MIYQTLLQCSAECCKCSPVESCDWGIFLLKCLCYFGKSLVVILFGLISVCLVVVVSIFLIWIVRQIYFWYKHSIKPHLKDAKSISCLNELREMNRNVCNISRINTEEIPDSCIVISLKGYLRRMDDSVRNYSSANASDTDKHTEMLEYQKELLCLTATKHRIELICKTKITPFVKDLTECLVDMANNKSGKELQEKFKSAKDGIEKLLS